MKNTYQLLKTRGVLGSIACVRSRTLKAIYNYFRFWHLDGTCERIHRALREWVRVRMNRDPQPSAGIVDSQSVVLLDMGDTAAGAIEDALG